MGFVARGPIPSYDPGSPCVCQHRAYKVKATGSTTLFADEWQCYEGVRRVVPAQAGEHKHFEKLLERSWMLLRVFAHKTSTQLRLHCYNDVCCVCVCTALN